MGCKLNIVTPPGKNVKKIGLCIKYIAMMKVYNKDVDMSIITDEL